MKYIISNLLLVFTITIKAQECKAVLSIETDNESAYVIINDAKPVNGKDFTFELEPGVYVINIGETTDRWDAKTFTDTIRIIKCEKIERQYKFYHHSMLETDPEDVYVYSADTLVGHTPLLLPPGINNVSLKKPGYEEVNIDFRQSALNEIVRLKPLSEQNSRNFFESSLFYYLSGSLLALGTATAYYKLKADNKFSEYQATGDEALLNETQRLDTISGVTFALLQINFAVLIYFFLND